MSQLQRACKTLGGLALVVALPTFVFGQSTNSTNFYATQGGEYAPAGALPGDQANPSISVNTKGGFLVWQDNITDGDGLGISAVQLDNNFNPKFGNFRVNQQGAGDQENPQVVLLPSGGAAFVWQGGLLSFQHIYARFLSASNLWITGDIEVNTDTNHYQDEPSLAVLTNGNIIVTWTSYGQDDPDGMQGVYGQILTPTGQKVGNEFLVNQFTRYNQRSSSVASFTNGNFIVAWVSEEERATQQVDSQGVSHSPGTTGSLSADVYARAYDVTGTPLTNTIGSEFLVNTSTNPCANPAVATASDNTFIIAWSQKDLSNRNNDWDVFAREFNSSGTGGTAQLVNSQLFGDQYIPRIASIGNDYMVVWTSLGQDGSREGVFSQFLKGDGSHAGGEQRVNTTILNQQEFPDVASDGKGRFLVAWSTLAASSSTLDIASQRYATTLQPLSPPSPPYIVAVDSITLAASWPVELGFNVSYYELFVDGSTSPEIVTNVIWSSDDFAPGSTHNFQLAYVLSDGRISPLSSIATGKTWGADGNHDGLPDDWETLYYGTNKANWPKLGSFTVLAPGVTAGDVFAWGANPNDPSTWLKQWISQGLYLNWNTVVGGVYQVQVSADLETWTNFGLPRFEAGTTDSVYIGQANGSYFRIMRNLY